MNYLKQSSKVAIAAPARCVTPEEMAFAIHWLKEQGFVPVYDDRLFTVHHIFAGDDDFRATVFQEYIDNEEIEAIWLARGGYGSIPSFCNIRNGSQASATARSFMASCSVWAFLRFIRPCLFILRTRPRKPNSHYLTH